ncbi:hypothetical protein HPB48_026408 [Haemaphysalis longicornis]|uniref:Uncharacterized protein n=1 Tax=Haemaphysalis longicornis TaxID=44386 RepID=A0A9J6HBU7_HAELO|nr:hypothetical protein HPB48_026408 [Haemaphysalis longicornis]
MVGFFKVFKCGALPPCAGVPGPFQEHHKYLQQAVLQLHRGQKIRTSQLQHLKSHVGGPNDASVWLLLSKLALCGDIGQGKFALGYWKQQWEGELGPDASTETLNHVLAVLRKVSRQLPPSACAGAALATWRPSCSS